MNVAIIGCGYVGKKVACYWYQDLKLSVTVTTTSPTKVRELEAIADRVIVVEGNDQVGLASVVQNQDTILLSIGAKNANLYEETYLNTAKTLIGVLKQHPEVRQLIYTGSYAVYGDRKGAWVDENSSLAPANRNGEILAQVEQLLLSVSSANLKVCIFRLGGIYGPSRELVKIFGRIAGTTRAGNGAEATNWIHLDDIVGAIEFARQHRLQGIYNLVDHGELTNRELIDGVLAKNGLPPVTWDTNLVSDRPYNARVSNQKLQVAGYQFKHPKIVI